MFGPEFQLLFRIADGGVIACMLATNLIFLAMLLIGYGCIEWEREPLTRSQADSLARSPMLPGISVLAPAFNESATIADSVRSMLQLRHPKYEVVVINDGSQDETMAVLIEEFKLYRSSRQPDCRLPAARVRAVYESREPIRLLVIDKENGGKSDALNAGLNYARMPLYAAVDADSLLEPDALLRISRPFLEDPATVAAGGIVRVVNGCRVDRGALQSIAVSRQLLARFQTVEYLRAFLVGRLAFGYLGSLLVISGAFGLFDRAAVIQAGGYATDTVGEDMELVARLHRVYGAKGKRRRITFLAEPVCWTVVPGTVPALARQRNRWQRGALETLARHRGLLFHRRWGAVACFGLPAVFLLEVLAPFAEGLGYLLTVLGCALGFHGILPALLFAASTMLFGLLLSVSAVLLDEATLQKYPAPQDLWRLLSAAVLENFGYHQLTCYWRIVASCQWLHGRTGWGPRDRRSFHFDTQQTVAASRAGSR